MEYPAEFMTHKQEDKVRIVKLGLSCWDIAMREAHNLLADDETLERLQKESLERISELTSKLQLLESTLSSRMELAQEVYKKQFEGEKLNAIKEAILQERENQQEELMDIRITCATLKAKDEYNNISSNAFDYLKDQLVKREDEVKNLNQQIQSATKVRTSQELGKIGEKEIECLFKEYVQSEITNMASIGHRGDFHIHIRGPNGESIKLLVDSKNYKGAVQKVERDKIIRDVDGDESISGGLMISLQSNIASRFNFEIEQTEKKKSILYISLKDLSYEESGRSVDAAIRVLTAVTTNHDAEIEEDLFKKIQAQTKELNLQIKEVGNMILSQQKQLTALNNLRETLLKCLKTLNSQESEEVTIVKTKAKRKKTSEA